MAGKGGPGGLGGLLRDKRVLIGAAVAGGAGLLALVMRKQSGGGGSAVQPAALDSSGTDLYNALQDISGTWRNDLAGFSDQLQNISDQLPQRPGAGTGSPTGATYRIDPIEENPRMIGKITDPPRQRFQSMS